MKKSFVEKLERQQTCPICKELGYLICEKPRKKIYISKRLRGNKKHKEYSSEYRERTSRYRMHHYVFGNGKRKSKLCYVGSLDFAIKKINKIIRYNKWTNEQKEHLDHLLDRAICEKNLSKPNAIVIHNIVHYFD